MGPCSNSSRERPKISAAALSPLGSRWIQEGTMVALRKNMNTARVQSTSSVSAKNLVRERKRDSDARKAERVRVAAAAWVCGAELSARGYALEMNAGGARFGGMGLK